MAKRLGLEFLDHIIIGQDRYFSFAEAGIMETLKLKLGDSGALS